MPQRIALGAFCYIILESDFPSLPNTLNIKFVDDITVCEAFKHENNGKSILPAHTANLSQLASGIESSQALVK